MKLGLIGAGNMGTAIVKGYIKAGADPASVRVLGHHPEKLAALKEETGVSIADGYADLLTFSDAVIVAVKPKDMPRVLGESSDFLRPEQIIVSIAAGKSLADIMGMLGGAGAKRKIIRVMPNTPALVGEGMSALCRNAAVTDAEFADVMAVFSSVGEAREVPESLMDAVVGLSGSGPAYVYMFIEALADGAVQAGMPRAQAYTFAAQTVLGSARMVLETGQHPGELKDAVCSPAGTTIEAVASLEAGGFRSIVMDAVMAAVEKSKNM